MPHAQNSACCDGGPQYSSRRGHGRRSLTVHGHPGHGRATPLSEGGKTRCPPCALQTLMTHGFPCPCWAVRAANRISMSFAWSASITSSRCPSITWSSE